MSERKNIDQIFQQKFKDFEVTPPQNSWANIEARLDRKKKKRIIPFWWKLSGVAAVFVIGFMISKSIYDVSTTVVNPVVNQGKSSKTTLDGADKNAEKTNEQIKTKNDVANEKNSSKTQVEVANQSEKRENNSDDSKIGNSVATENNFGKTAKANVQKGTEINSSSGIIAKSYEVKIAAESEGKNKIKKTFTSLGSHVVEKKPANNSSLKNESTFEKDTEIGIESAFEKPQNHVALNSESSKKNYNATLEKEPKYREQTNQIAQETVGKNLKTSGDIKNFNPDALKEESISKIVTQETVIKVNDTAAKNSVVVNALEELLNEKESKTKQESKRNRWQVLSNVAPVFLGSISNGSPIDSTLSTNSKSYNTNVGFGVGVSYAVNKKLSVRTGLNKFNVSYNTNDISFFSAIQAKTMKNINPIASSANIQIQSNVATNTQISSETAFLPFENSFVNANTGYLKQEMGYLEIPVELTYNLLDKKFGITIIGGFSTLLLQDNSLEIISQGRETLLGEANNLSDVHFSTNVGLGIKYGFMKSFEFNIEPILKYQLNTFTDNAGNFKPYIFGIYSGISYKF